MATLGERIKELRKEKGLTQEQLAEAINTTANTVARWERGEQMPLEDEKHHPIVDLQTYFQVPLFYLLGITDSHEWPDAMLRDEEAAEAALAENQEIEDHMLDLYHDLSEEMQGYIRYTVGNAYKYDRNREKLKSQQRKN